MHTLVSLLSLVGLAVFVVAAAVAGHDERVCLMKEHVGGTT